MKWSDNKTQYLSLVVGYPCGLPVFDDGTNHIGILTMA